jgi:hypothetical protein
VILADGVTNIPVVVTAQDGVTQKTYTLSVTKSLLAVADQADIGNENDLLTNPLNVTGTANGIVRYTIAAAPQKGAVQLDSEGNYYYRRTTWSLHEA